MFNICIYTFFFLTYWITWQHHYTQYQKTTINCTYPPPTPSILHAHLGHFQRALAELEPTEAFEQLPTGPFFKGIMVVHKAWDGWWY